MKSWVLAVGLKLMLVLISVKPWSRIGSCDSITSVAQGTGVKVSLLKTLE